MTIAGLVLVLTAAFCHAAWNVVVKRINAGPELIWLFSAVALVIYAPAALYIVVVERPVFGAWEIGFICGSTVLHLGYFLLLQRGYRGGDLSLVYPTARSTGPFLSAVFAVAILGELVTLQIAIGGGLVIIGVFGLTGGGRSAGRKTVPSFLFGIGAGLFIASYTVWDAYAVSTLLIAPLLLDYASSAGRVVLLTPVAWRRRVQVAQLWRDHRGGVVAIAFFSPLAYILVLYALSFTPVVYVAPARELSVLITVVAGSILLGEGDLRRRMQWAVVMVSGVALLATG